MSDTPQSSPPPRRRRRVWRGVLAFFVLLVVLVGGAIWYALSESGLPFLIARVVAQSGGRLAVEGVSGSVGSTMRFARLTWNGAETTVEATDVVVEWSPGALWRKELAVRGLGAGRVSIAMKPSAGPTTPPTNLALPLDVRIERLAVTELAVRAGPRVGTIHGLAFGYRGNAREHAVDGLRFVSDYGSLSGNMTLGASAPLPIGGRLAVVGDGILRDARLDTKLGGTLAAVALDARGALRGAELEANAQLTPFAATPLTRATLALRHVDAAAFDEALPKTAVEVNAVVQPTSDGFAGEARVVNEVPGALDQERFPFRTLRARYHWHPAAVELDDLVIELPGGGEAQGRGRLPLGEPPAPSTWQLTLRNVDPALLHGKLLHARIAGRIEAQVEGARQSIEGTLADGRNELAFAATVAARRLDLTRARLRTAGGVIEGRGTMALDGANAFEAHVAATRFDPSRFVATAPASLDGTADVRGTARPLTLQGEAIVKPGSRYGSVAVSGTARGAIAPSRVRNAQVDATVGTVHVTLSGDAGAVGDQLAFTVNAQRIADVAPLLPAAVPHPSSGALQAQGTLRIEPGGIGFDVRARGTQVRLSDGTAAATLLIDATIAPGGAAARPVSASERRFDVKASTTMLEAAGRRADQASLDVSGTLARHTLAVRGMTEGVRAEARASGSVTLPRDLRDAAWSGRVETLTTSGTLKLALRSPATLEVARTHVRVADAHVDIADGRADVTELRIDEGRITTQGSFTGVPLTSVLALAGRPAPVASTLVLGGDWSIAATPRLSGRFAVRREAGDLYASETLRSGGLSFGITALEVNGTLRDDALSALAVLRSTRGGDARGEIAIGSVSGAAAGHLSRTAPLRATLDAELASLAPLQPWMGTQAVVDGRLRASLRAGGTLGDPILSGSLEGSALRIDAPQYGVHITDGRLRAHIVDDAVALDELTFAGGDGRFTARGTLALPGRAQATRVQWHAERFRVADRPDLKLVVAGDGTLAIVDKRVALAGTVKVEEGHVEYEASPPGRLGDDVVVKGRPVSERQGMGLRDFPLTLDLDVDLVRLTFYGEGLDAALAGRVKVTTTPAGTLRGSGTIRTVYGTYYAFGQKLTIDRGRLIFDGPLDDPALDVVALRKNLAVEAGIELTGTVKVPRVRLTSSPPVPENEALAWLITGQGLSGSGRSDFAALSAASAALLGRKGKPVTTRIAEQFGLDDISLQSSGTATGTSSNPVAGQVVVFGKRISDRLTLGYEQGLALASGALRLEYALTRTWTLRAEAGTVSAIGLIYRRSFE